MADGGSSFGVTWGDVDGDGAVDMFVARDIAVNQLWMNTGDGSLFEEAATEWGVAGASSDRSHGCSFADIDGDGDMDLFVSLLYGGINQLYVNNGTSLVEDGGARGVACLLYTSPSPRDRQKSRMPSSA